MATEATLGGPVDVSSSEPLLNRLNATGTETQDAGQSTPVVNGPGAEIENKVITEIADELVNSAEASVSGGSDTEAFKSESAKVSGDKSHVRSSSAIKKPLSFKSVSVNRTFLASKGATNSATRPESAAGSTSSTPQPSASSTASRLKLVAKSGSGLGGASKTLAANGKTSAAPDPSSVWNRNRVPAQPEAKKRSDEELKNDGIHMADRLGPEDLKGQSNWADIEDDDEWAPETITWTDGTKITLSHTEDIPASPSVHPASVTKMAVQKEPVPAPKTMSPAPAASHPPEASSIRPGVLGSGKGLVLKGAPEKPTLVAKPPPTPGPVKSPWAALPPVDKVSPVVMDIRSQAPPPRHAMRELSNAKSATPPPATKEIPADDFGRNYRDAPSNPGRELYNSQSGRYEPVTDRRGSRGDIHARHPALLQRPIHNEQQAPAEPSVAFQTSRSSLPEGPYGRRRGSSNVSGGSGHFAARLGGKLPDGSAPHDLGLMQGQGPHAHPVPMPRSADSPGASLAYPQTNHRVHPGQGYPQPFISSHQNPPSPYSNTFQTEAQKQAEADLDRSQKEYMKQKREEAIRRRVEEERREEAAKQARIAEKLKALGPAPERKSAKKEAPSVAQRTDVPASLAARSKATSDAVGTSDQTPVAAASSETSRVETSTPTEPLSNEPSETSLRQPNGSAQRPLGYEQLRGPPAQQVATTMNNQHAPSWSEPPHHPDRFQPWTSGHQNASRNVWGAPGNDRSLGNGTFNADIGPLPESHVGPSSNTIHRPGPFGPPRHNSQVAQPEVLPNRLPPIGPPRAQPNPASAWKNFDVKADDERRRLERIKEREAMGDRVTTTTFADTWRPVSLDESGRRIVGNVIRSRGDVVNEPQALSNDTSHPDTGRSIPNSPSAAAPPTGPSPQTRTGSRFFPTSREPQPDASVQLSTRSKSPTPPPPTADGHPVYDGDATKPHVSLPPLRPRVKLPPSAQSDAHGPIAPPPKQAAPSFAAAASSAPASRAPDANTACRPTSRGPGFSGPPQKPHEIASQENWQSKINSLMGKKSASTAKSVQTPSMTVPIEFPRPDDAMDVPVLSPSGTDMTEDSSFTSKEMAEQCFGEQEMGSLPAVRLPTETPEAAWQAVLPNWQPAPAKLRVDPTASESFRFGLDYAHGKSVIRIFAPGMPDAKTVVAPVLNPRSGSNPRRGTPRGAVGARHPSSRGGRRGPRDTSEPASEHLPAPTSGRTVSSRGPRNFQARRETWSRQPSASTAQS
ncbi:hypothetical protein F5Y17DRAFT_456645 [Xylariaceae sp. FL0594]|nr:hypothetical protein F5Y17DRAFT_456645 [Xylariaceae sp. FL0594]